MAEQYSWISANNEGYSAGKFSDVDGNIMPWSRSTVADGKWLNREMLLPFSGRDQYLLKSLNQTYDECSAFSGYLNEEIRIINARADVIDVVGSHDAFTARSAELVSGVDISDRDVIKILNDVGTDIPVWIYDTANNVYVESTVSPSNQQTYYRWLSAVNDGPSGWEYVGDLEPYYKDIDLTENSIKFENTAPERDYTVNTDTDKYIQMSVDGRTGTIGLTDEFINSASQCYIALTSHSASWDETSATLNANSGYWDQAYDWSKSSSADLISVSSTFVEYSGKWNDASATLYNNSANWQATYSAVSANSAIWNETAYISILNTYSGKWVSAISAEDGVLNGPVVKFKVYDKNENLYLTVNPNENQITFGLSDTIDLKKYSTDTYTAKPLIRLGTEGPGTIIYSAALNGYIASAYMNGPGWSNPITATASWFDIINSMPNTALFSAKGNPGNFNQTYNYSGFTLSAGEGIGFYNAGTNSLGISAQAGIPDGTLTYTMMYGPGGHPYVQDFNISSLNINNYTTTQNTDYINLNITASNGSTASFALWPEDITLTAKPVPATLIPIVDPTSIKQKKYMQVSDLNIGNYVSAGDNQKLTIMSAENLTLANMQPGIIYLV